MKREVDQNRLARIQDERFFICIETDHMYEIKDIKIIESEVWVQSMNDKVYRDSDVMTVSESGDHYRLRSWMKQKLNIQ